MSTSATLGLVGLLGLAAGTEPAALGSPATPDHQRRQTIQATLEALKSIDARERADTYNYLYAVERNQCQAPLRSLKIGCLLEAARRNCRQRRGPARRRCRLVSDVIVANRFSEPRFLPRSVRYRIMNEHRNYRTELLAELRRRYARLVTGLYLDASLAVGAPPEVLAQAIDTYCLDVAGRRRRLSWSHCVAAVVWFIGTSRGEETETP